MLGDSHVCHCTEVSNYKQHFNLEYATIELKHQGGAGMNFLWDVHDARHDIIVFCLGSNNLDSGMQSAELFKQLMFHMDRYRTLELRDYVVIMGLWPLAIGDFTVNIRVHSQFSTKKPGIFYWKWSKSLNIIKSDRVYLVTTSHWRAV